MSPTGAGPSGEHGDYSSSHSRISLHLYSSAVRPAPNGREPLVGEWHLTTSSLTRYLNEARFGAGRDGARPAVIDPGILVDGPTQLLETLRKRCERPPNRRIAEKGEPSPGGALCKRDRDQSRAKQDKTGNGDGAETVRSEFITHGTAYRSRSTGILSLRCAPRRWIFFLSRTRLEIVCEYLRSKSPSHHKDSRS